MSFLGFLVTIFIFLSTFDAKITESICQCRFEDDVVEVCKGDSTVIKPSAIRSADTIQSVKFIRNTGTGYQCNSGQRMQKSSMIKLSNIGEDDTGIYRFRVSAARIYCIEVEINCEPLVVPSGSSVNLTCKVKNLDYVVKWNFSKKESSANSTSSNGTINDNVFHGGRSPPLRTLTLRQVKKGYSGNYTCIARKKVSGGETPTGHYTIVLKVYEPQLIATTKETSQEKQTSRFSLPTVVSDPTTPTRKETTPGFTAHTNTTKDKASGVSSFTAKWKQKTTSQTSPQTASETTKETVPSTKEGSTVVQSVEGEREKRTNSIGTRVNYTFSVLVLNQLYIWIWRIYATTV